MTPSDSPTGAPTLTAALRKLKRYEPVPCAGNNATLQQTKRGACVMWADVERALSAQAPPSETVDRALNVFHEYAESQARAGAQAPPAPDPRELLLQWVDLDAISSGAARRSAREMLTAKTCHYLNSTEAGTPQAAIGAPQGPSQWEIDEERKAIEFLHGRHPAQAVASSPLRETVQSHIADLVDCVPSLRRYGFDVTAAQFEKAIEELRAALAGSPDPSLPPPKERS